MPRSVGVAAPRLSPLVVTTSQHAWLRPLAFAPADGRAMRLAALARDSGSGCQTLGMSGIGRCRQTSPGGVRHRCLVQ